MSSTATKPSWTKPAAMAIPKEGFFELEQGRYGPIFPKTPACYGFTIIAKIKPGTEQAIREYGKKIEKTIAGLPDGLAVLKLHYLRWVLFDIGTDTYFMYQGIFDTDFDKYTEDAVALFSKYGINTVFENLEGLPRGLEDEPAGVRQVRPRAPVPELPGIRRVSLRERRRDQEGAQAQGGVLRHARPDAVEPPAGDAHARTRRHSAHPADPDAGAHGALRVPLVSRSPAGGAGLARRHPGQRCGRPADVRASVDEDKRWVTVAFTWNGLRALGVDEASLAHLPRRVQAGHGRPGGGPRRHRGQSSRPLGGRPGQPGPPRHRHPLRPRRRGARALQSGAPRTRSRSARVWRCSRRWTWRPPRRSTTRTTTSATATGSRSRSSRAAGDEPTPGSGGPLKPGEFFLGYPDEDGHVASLPQPEILSRNGSYLAYRRLRGARGRVPRLPARSTARRPRSRS